jgi:pimeloyl-ACP methyl ester carboxylesterase
MFDQGSGPPLIVVPGVQGRWEWMRPALETLARRCRTVSYTLTGDFGTGQPVSPADTFDTYVRQLDDVMDWAGVERAAVCGVSYGGLVALRYAATRPERVSALIIVSAPAPGWTPSERQARYIARPWLSTPAFLLTSPARIWPEIRAALQDWGPRIRFVLTHGLRVLMAPMIPARMAGRVRLQQQLDFCGDCGLVRAPTLIVTGEDGLDTVVPVDVTRQYRCLIPGARYEMMDRTGHIGMLTQPQRFAGIVCNFVHAHSH